MLLTLGKSNKKTEKSESALPGWSFVIHHMLPSDYSGIANVCLYASKQCRAVCLNTSGLGGVFPSIQKARLEKVRKYVENPGEYQEQLSRDILRMAKRAAWEGKRLAVRLNGTSDVDWSSVYKAVNESLGYPEREPGSATSAVTAFATSASAFATSASAFACPTDQRSVIAHEYTKAPANKRLHLLKYGVSLTYSLTEEPISRIRSHEWRQYGVNTAVVFHGKELPNTYVINGVSYPVIDGDEHDGRFLDPVGVVVGLRAKWTARRLPKGGFSQ